MSLFNIKRTLIRIGSIIPGWGASYGALVGVMSGAICGYITGRAAPAVCGYY